MEMSEVDIHISSEKAIELNNAHNYQDSLDQNGRMLRNANRAAKGG
jgi:hypothetical protein